MNTSSRRAFLGGAVAGLIAGFVLALYTLGTSLGSGADPWVAAKLAGTPFLGPRAMQPGFDAFAVAVGVLCHLGVSIAWGIPFGFLAYDRSAVATITGGVLWGLVCWIGMFHVLLPALGLQSIAASVPTSNAIIEHVLSGLALAAAFLPSQPPAAPGLAPRIDPSPSPADRARAS